MQDFDWEKYKYITVPMGIKLVFKNKYIFAANPFNNITIDAFIRREITNILTTQNNKLLFEFGDILQNNIFITLCENVLQGNKLNQDYLISLYYPILYKKNITSLRLLQENKQQLLESQKQKNDKKYIEYNKTIDFLHDVYNKKNSDLDYLHNTPGITEIEFTIHPIYKIVFPLEILFKIINSSINVPMIKFNPGKKNENIYRFYTGFNVSDDGRKIPYLYTNSSNKRNKILKIARQIATTKKVSFYIEFKEEEKQFFFFCDFLQNGNIIIRTSFQQPKKIKFIEKIIHKYINKPIIKKIKNFLENSGYTYIDFKNLNSENIEINKISYSLQLNINKKINIKPIRGCLSSVFNLLTSNNDNIDLIYKRVGNYSELDAQQSFINNLKKQNIDSEKIIIGLKENFKISLDEAKRKYIEWASGVQTELGLFANKKLSILTNSGFPVFIRKNKITNDITITVQNINNIGYIDFIHLYIDSIFRLIIDKTSSDVEESTIKKICSKVIDINIQKEEEITAKVESALLDREKPSILTSGDITFENELDNDFLDLVMGGDDEDNSEEEEEEDDDDIWDDDEDDGEDFFGSNIVMNVAETQNTIEDSGGGGESKSNIFDSAGEDSKDYEPIDLEGEPIKGTKSIFMKKKLELEPKLFLKTNTGRYNAYSKSCQAAKAKQPIMLTSEELKYIDDIDKTNQMKSYDEFLTYRSDKEKEEKYHYICPRFWCMADENGKNRSITLEEINKGGCGGWDALIPQGSSKVPKGKRIYEFTDDRWHKENVKTDNRLVYKPMFPGYQGKDKHPEGLCVPCCFTKPSRKSTDDTALKHMYKPEGKKNKEGIGPYYKVDSNGNIELDTIDPNAKKQKREKPSDSQIKKFKICDQKKEEVEEQTVDSKEKTYGSPLDGDESFPLNMGQLGYLPSPVVLFLQYSQQYIILSQVGRNLIINEDNKPPARYSTGLLSRFTKKGKQPISYLLRKGVEESENQSFLSCIADAYGHIQDPSIYNLQTTLKTKPIKSIGELKQHILKNLKLDSFVKLQNGNLVRIFFKESKSKINIEKYKDSQIIKYISKNISNSEIYLYKMIAAFKNFKNYIKSNKVIIDYEFLWDFLCTPKSRGGLFNYGLNLFIINSPNDDITQKIEVICPTNHFNNEHYSSEKPTLILYSKNGYYEPIYRYTRISKDEYKIMKTFELENIKKTAPEISNIFLRIRSKLIEECKPLPSLPDRFKFRENILLNQIKELLINYLPHYTIQKQVINYNYKTIAIIVQNNKTNKMLYLPVLPSGIVNNIEFLFVGEPEIIFNLSDTVKMLKEINELSRKKIPSKPKMFLNDEGKNVGIVTETNQFIPTIPEDIDDTNHFDLEEINDKSFTFDKDIITNNDIDDKRVLAVKKIKLETNFYNVFRNTLRMLMDNLEMKSYRNALVSLCESNTLSHMEKHTKVFNLLQIIMNKFIAFSKFDIHSSYDIDKLTSCINLSSNKCNSQYCTFDNGEQKCKLILPKKNLYSGADNSILYFRKLADELTRQKMIQNFILKPKTYLSFQKVNYQLDNNEIILLEELLFTDYFNNLTPIPSNKFIQDRNTYDYIQPISSYSYKTRYNSDELYNDVKSEINSNCIQDFNKNLSFNYWKKNRKVKLEERKRGIIRYNVGLDQANYKILEFKQNNFCSWEIFRQILIKQEILDNIETIRQNLIQIFKTKITQGYGDYLFNILKTEMKQDNYNFLINGTDLDIVITIHNYYLSILDFFLLSEFYNINLIILSSNKIKINNDHKISWNTSDEYCYIIFTSAFQKNKAPTYGLAAYNDNIKIPIKDLKVRKIYDEMTSNNVSNIDSLITMFQNPVQHHKSKKPKKISMKTPPKAKKLKKRIKISLRK